MKRTFSFSTKQTAAGFPSNGTFVNASIIYKGSSFVDMFFFGPPWLKIRTFIEMGMLYYNKRLKKGFK